MADGEDERADRLRELARDTERAWISTIHGFCRRVLAAHPVALGLDPRFRVLDAAEADRVAAEAFDGALEELLEAADPERANLVAAMQVGELRRLVLTAYAELRSQGREPRLPDPPQPDPVGAVRALIDAAKRACAETEGGAGHKARERLASAAALDPERWPPDRGGARRARAVLGGAGIRRLRRAPPTGRRGDGRGPPWSRAARAPRTGTSRSSSSSSPRTTRGSRTTAPGSTSRTCRSSPRRLLERAEIGEAYREPLQPPAGRRVPGHQPPAAAADRGAARARRSELIVVGDEFQSIYGFRHADLDVFRERARRGSRSAPTPRLMRAERQLPLAPGADRAPSTLSARRCSASPTGRSRVGAPTPSGRPRADAARRSSCC